MSSALVGGSSSHEAPSGGTSSDNGAGGGEAHEPLSPGAAKFEPPEGRTLFIVGQDKGPMQEYVAEFGVPAGFMNYTTISFLNGFDEPTYGEFPDRMDFHYWPDTHDGIVMQTALALNDTATIQATLAGTYDSALDSLANHFQAANVPVYLRVDYEVQGKFASSGYPEVFRYIRGYFEARGVTNVAYVWHVTPGYTTSGVDNHFDWYPGDDVVDWIGISYFLDVVGRYAPNDSSQSGILDETTFAQVKSNLDTIVGYARAHEKPIMIAESAPQKMFEPALGQASWDGWYAHLFDFVEEHDIEALCYINERWADFSWPEHIWGDSRIQTNPIVQAAFLNEVNKPRYLHASPELYSLLGD